MDNTDFTEPPASTDIKPYIVSGLGFLVALFALLLAWKAKSATSETTTAKDYSGEISTLKEELKKLGDDFKAVRNLAANTRAATQSANDKVARIDIVESKYKQLETAVWKLASRIDSAPTAAGKRPVVVPPAGSTGTTKQQPAAGGSTAAPAGNQVVNGYILHKVQDGEFPSNLAKKYGVKTSDITNANPGVDFKRLKIGDILKIPQKKASAAPRNTAPAQRGNTSAPRSTTGNRTALPR